MAFNLATFKTRALTAIVFVLVMLAGLLWNQWSFFILFTIIHFGCWIEYQKLVGLIDADYQKINPLHRYGVMITGWGVMVWVLDDRYRLGDISLPAAGWWMFWIGLLLFLIGAVDLGKKTNPRLWAHSFM